MNKRRRDPDLPQIPEEASLPITTADARTRASRQTDKEKSQEDAITKRLEAALSKATDDLPGGLDELLKSFVQEANDHLDHTHPGTKAHHDNAKNTWHALLHLLYKEIPRDRHWARETVKMFAGVYLVSRFKLTPGRNGPHVKASTVAMWAVNEVFCIAHLAFDPETNERCGRELLVKDEIFKIIHTTVKDLIVRNQLDRHVTTKFNSYGPFEFKLYVEQLMHGSVERRETRLQLICVGLILFGSGARPCAIASGWASLIAQGNYMRMGDLEFYRTDDNEYEVHIYFRQSKGSMQSVSVNVQKHVYRPLKQVQNLVFDPVWFIAMYHSRGAFKYKTMAELFDSKEHKLEVLIPDEPFFLLVNSGGHKFQEPHQPGSAKNISGVVSATLKSVGLDGSAYWWRRGAATEFETLFGNQMAGRLIQHTDGGTLARCYSLGPGTIDVLRGRLEGPFQSGIQDRLEMNQHIGAYVAMAAGDMYDERTQKSNEQDDSGNDNDGTDTDDDGMTDALAVRRAPGKQAQSFQEELRMRRRHLIKKALKAHEEYQGLVNTVRDTWPELLEPLVRGSDVYQTCREYRRCKMNFGTIKKQKEYKTALKANPTLSKKHDKIHETIVSSFKRQERIKGEVTKKIDGELGKTMRKEKAQRPATTEDIKKAVLKGKETSHIVFDAVTASRSSVDEMKSYIAELGSADDDQDDDTALHEETASMMKLVPVGEKDAKELQTVACIDQEDPNNCFQPGGPLQPIDDSAYKASVNAMDSGIVRRVMAQHAVAPIEAKRAMERNKELDGGVYLCQECKKFPDHQERRKVFPDPPTLSRHLLQHTVWYDLELQMSGKEGKQFGCPAVNCARGFDTIPEVRTHCVSDECPEHRGFQTMKDADAEMKRFNAVKPASLANRNHAFQKFLRNCAIRMEAMDEDMVRLCANVYETPMDEVEVLMPDILAVAEQIGKYGATSRR